MPRADTIQTNFTAGEVSPLIKGRVDITRYHNGVERLENFIVLPQGGIRRRSGTRFANEIKDQTKQSILIPFEFSTIQSYMLEFGDLYIRVYKDGGIVESVPGTPVEVVTPYTESDLPDLALSQSADVLYICHPSYQPRKLSRTSHTAWSLSLYEPQDGPYLPTHTGDTAMTLSSIVDRATIKNTVDEFVVGDVGDYVEYDLDGEKTLGLIISVTSGTEVVIQPFENVLASLPNDVDGVSLIAGIYKVSAAYFERGNVGSFVRIEQAPNSWHLTNDFDGSSRDDIAVDAALTMTATTGILRRSIRTITATCTATDATFVAGDVGRLIRFNFSGEQVWAEITAFTSTTVVSVELKRSMPLKSKDSSAIRNDGVTFSWRLGAWSDTTGWPSAITFHEERLVFANTTEEPQTVWMSKSADYELFSPTEEDSIVLDDNGLTYTIASGQVNSILWLESGPVLLLGTIGGEWQIKASSIAEPITPTNVVVVPQTRHGSKKVDPIKAGSTTIFLQRAGRKLRELVFNFEIDAYVAKDLTIISEHILRDGTSGTDLSYQRSPNSLIWVLREDGELAALTYIRDHETFAWHRHILGGSFGSGNTVVESIATIPSITGTEDTTYVIVKRTINGATKRYVEYFETDFDPADATDKDDMYFVDSFLVYDSVPTTTITGLSHLEGEEVQILADGANVPPKTVSAGQITLDNSASTVIVGLQMISVLKTLPVEGGSDTGTSQGKIKRVDKLTLRIIDSLGFLHGSVEGSLTQRSFRKSDGAMDDSPDLFTGDISFNLEQGYQSEAGYFVKQNVPYPLTILSVMPEFVANRS